MANPFYTASGNPGQGAFGYSATMRGEFQSIQAAFDKMPSAFTANKVVVGAGTTLTLTAGSLSLANDLTVSGTSTINGSFSGSFTSAAAVTFSGAFALTWTVTAAVNLTLPATNDTLVGRATTDTLTNKTFDTAGAGNVLKVNGTTVSAISGSGAVVLASGATLTNPIVGTQTAADNSTKAASTAYADRVLANMVLRTQVFTANSTYTPNANMIYCIIECWGGGGGGGGAVPAGTGGQCATGGGGGAGSYSRKLASASDIGVSKTVTVGTAGGGGSAGNNNGTAGGDTSVGVLCVGKGGSGGAGQSGAALTPAAGGAGGVAGTGDVTARGENGGWGQSYWNADGIRGGDSMLGSGGQVGNGTSPATGGAASGFAAGGGGAYAPNGTSNQAGGAGSAGYVIITEFCKV